jgi:hypothetical protein
MLHYAPSAGPAQGVLTVGTLVIRRNAIIDDASTGDQARHAQAAQHPPGEGFLAVHYSGDEAATVGAGHVDWLMSKGGHGGAQVFQNPSCICFQLNSKSKSCFFLIARYQTKKILIQSKSYKDKHKNLLKAKTRQY